MKSSKIILTILIPSMIVLIFSGCGGMNTVPSINQSPTIISFTANPQSPIEINQNTAITCSASDPDGDSLTYTWTTTGGIITGTGSAVTWTAPFTRGNYTISCIVSDGMLNDTQSLTITVEDNSTYTLRDIGPAGGWVFYDKGYVSNGWRYLEAAPGTQDLGMQWSLYLYLATGATGTAIGAGQVNTTAIVTTQGSGDYAAKFCDALLIEHNSIMYDDWFLPSKDELNLMYINLKVEGFGNFESNYYWSSSETLADGAWNQHFGDGSQSANMKDGQRRVRAIRSF